MHSRKRSAAFLSDDTNDTLAFSRDGPETPAIEEYTPSKRLLHRSGISIPTSQPKLKYNAPRLLNNLAFTRLYVTANFQAWDPATSPVVLCCVDEQSDLYRAVCEVLPSLYNISPNIQALAMTAGYLNPNAMSDQSLSRILPQMTTAGLEGTVAEEFEAFREDLGPGDCVALVTASGVCTWTSREASSLQDMQQQLTAALANSSSNSNEGGDVAMPDG